MNHKKIENYDRTDIITEVGALLIAGLASFYPVSGYFGKKIFLLYFVCMAVAGGVFLLLLKKTKQALIHQLAVVSVPPVLVLSILLYRNGHNLEYEETSFHLLFVCLIAYFFMCLSLIKSILEKIQACRVEKVKTFFVQHRAMLFVLVAAGGLRMLNVNLLPRWDSGEYYFRYAQAIREFTFMNRTDLLETFSLCGHPTNGFALIYAPGELLFTQRVIGVSLTSIFLTLLVLWCIYKMLLHMVTGLCREKAALLTGMLSMAPLFYCEATYFNPDYAMTLFLVFLLYGYVMNKPVIAGAAAMLCFQTKETGLVIVGGLVIGIFVQKFIINPTFMDTVKSLFFDLRLWLTLLATLLHWRYTKIIGSLSGWTQTGEEQTGLVWNNHGYNCLGFNLNFIGAKFRQFFILNFNWLVVLLIVVGIGYLTIYCRRKGYEKAMVRYPFAISGVCGAFFALMTFSSLYITASVARYNVPQDMLMYIIWIYILAKVDVTYHLHHKNVASKTKKDWVKYHGVGIAAALMTLLFLVESFVVIDPLTKCMFLKLDAGSAKLYFTGTKREDKDIYYGDYLIYNTQFMYIDRAYDKMLREVDYDPDTMDIMYADSNGMFLTGNNPLYYLNWDRAKKKRVFYSNANTKEMYDYYELRTIHRYELKRENEGFMQKAVLVINPYMKLVDEERCLLFITEAYHIGERKEIKTFQGSIMYYELERK